MLSAANRIWNRAALDRGGLAPRAGDRALAAVLLAHGFVMNGGVAHALTCWTAHQIQAACDGYRRFGFGPIAALLGTVTTRGEEDELAADAAYARELPDDGLLQARFVADYEARPSDYAE